MVDLAQFSILLFGGTISFALFLLAVKLMQTNKATYELNKRASGSFWRALQGTVTNLHEGGHRNEKIAAGISFDKKSKKLVVMGRLSDESVRSMLNT